MHDASLNGTTLSGPLGHGELSDVWPKAEAMLELALEREGKHTTGDILELVSNGLMGIYIVRADESGELLSVLCLEVLEYPRECVMNIAYCGGVELYRWAGLLGALEAEAARVGCQTMRITGRPGWGRIFPDYRETNRVFERKVVMS